ncbi:hypothetical protein SAMN03159488_03354 [Pseudomonas sp. NFIX10]|nr:hypothetical protein SAMN03159488_03354 [Pseudomonas sp. NFIX10]SFF44553.1 hypothetical protein SAMN03159367_04593 [Pseudomonas sp. NFACC06-1]
MYILQVLRMAEKNTPAQQDAADLCEKGTDLFYSAKRGQIYFMRSEGVGLLACSVF